MGNCTKGLDLRRDKLTKSKLRLVPEFSFQFGFSVMTSETSKSVRLNYGVIGTNFRGSISMGRTKDVQSEIISLQNITKRTGVATGKQINEFLEKVGL